MHIGGVVDQVAQPDNILLLQDLGLNAAVRKISAEQLELLKQIALNAIAYPRQPPSLRSGNIQDGTEVRRV